MMSWHFVSEETFSQCQVIMLNCDLWQHHETLKVKTLDTSRCCSFGAKWIQSEMLGGGDSDWAGQQAAAGTGPGLN